jgi:sarcosine oxidase subunit alpha
MTADTNAPPKLTALYGTAQRLGAQFVELAGWRFADAYAARPAELEAARSRVGLADVSAHGKLQIEGVEAPLALRAALGAAPEAIGAGQHIDAGTLYCVRRDLYYLSTPPGGEPAAQARLQSAIAEARWFVTVTDVTHGLAELCLAGPRSRDVLRKLCALDFHPDLFPDLTARPTSVAKTRQLVMRRDFGPVPAFSLAGAQSLAAYVWDVIAEAGREFGLAPIGIAALAELERNA